MRMTAVFLVVIAVLIICLVGFLGGSKSIRDGESNADRIAKEISALGVEVKILRENIYFFAIEDNLKFNEALSEFMKRYPEWGVKSKNFDKYGILGFGSGYIVVLEEKKISKTLKMNNVVC